MMRSFLLAGLTASTLLMPLALRAGTPPGAASGVINIGSTTTGQSTASFSSSSSPTTAVTLSPALSVGLSGAQASAAQISTALAAPGGSSALSNALSESLQALGSNPTIGTLGAAVTAFNALVNGAIDAASLSALAAELGSVRAELQGIVASINGGGG